CRDHFGDLAVHVNAPDPAAAHLSHNFENPSQRYAFATEDVALSGTSALHGKDQPFGSVAHIDEIHDKIEMQLETPAEKIPEHRRRRRHVVIVGPDRHRGTAYDERVYGCGRLHSESIRAHFR